MEPPVRAGLVTRRRVLAAIGSSGALCCSSSACSLPPRRLQPRTVTVALPEGSVADGVPYEPLGLALRGSSLSGDARRFSLQPVVVSGWYPRSPPSDEKLHALFAAQPPEVVLAPAHSIGSLARAGQLAPLSQFLDRVVLSTWSPSELVAGARSLGMVRGQRWALPLLGVPTVLTAAQGALEDAGYVDLLHSPKALPWAAFEELASRLTTRSPAGDLARWGFHPAPYGMPWLAVWIWQNGGSLLDPVTNRVRSADRAGVEALAFLMRLVGQGLTPPLGSSHVTWLPDGQLLAPPPNVASQQGRVPVATWIAPAHQAFYAPSLAPGRTRPAVRPAQLPQRSDRACLLIPTALLAVSRGGAAVPEVRMAALQIATTLEGSAALGLPLRHSPLVAWKDRRSRMGDAATAAQLHASLESARCEYVEGTVDLVLLLDLAVLEALQQETTTTATLELSLQAVERRLKRECGVMHCG